MDFGQIVTAALQTSPDRLVALAVMRSLPAGSPMRRSTENEPLGAFVVALVFTTDLPLRRSRTLHFAPSGSGTFRIRRAIPDFEGADQVAARASGPRGNTCEATGLLPGA
jgi:hypothetical protein